MSLSRPEPKRHLALRIEQRALDQIDAEARKRGLNRTDYMIQASTGTLEDTTTQALRRIEQLERDVQRLQAIAY